MEKIISISKVQLQLLIIFFFLGVQTYLSGQNYCGSTPVSVHGKLKVSGTKIQDQNNQVVSFAGSSMFWSNEGWGAEKYYNADIVNWLADDWDASIVRAAMGVEDNGGYLSNAGANKARVKAVVDAAIARGLYVIIDWHSHHAEDYEAEAIAFFQEMAETYGNTPNVIYEIYNEPLQVSWTNTIKPYAEAVISAIRAIDPDNLIIVGTSTWSQDVDIASSNPITGVSNIAYTLHFYAATHKASLRQKAQTALDNGIALMVTEWGTVNNFGAGAVDAASTDTWMNFLDANDISHANWSTHDKVEGASQLKPGTSPNGNWVASDLTTSGSFVRGIVKNWGQYCPDNDNQAPIVEITSPANNGSMLEGGSVQFSVSASDQDGSVTSVQFFANGNLVGSRSSFPYSISWNPSAGNYLLEAVATDNAGSSTSSASILFTVNGVGGGSAAFPDGTPHSIPGTINATNFDTGGQGLAYNDNDLGNNGSGPRASENVDTEYRTAGGNVGWIQEGEWLTYSTYVATTGSYDIDFEVASLPGGGAFQLQIDGTDVTPVINVDATGGWGVFTNVVTTNVQLSAGDRVLRIDINQGGFNLGDMLFTLSNQDNGNTQPMVELTAPGNNASFMAGSNISIAATSSDSDGFITKVDFFANGDFLATDASEPYGISWNPTFEGTYDLTALATDNEGAIQTSSTRTIAVTGGQNSGSCNFGAPQNLPFASLSTTYSNIHVIGNGPNLSNVRKFTINYDLTYDGLYQLSLNTDNGAPSWWVNLISYADANLNTSNPDISFSGTGISSLDGAYWITLDGDNLVLVSKNAGFTIYCSNNPLPPPCSESFLKTSKLGRLLALDNNAKGPLILYPNPSRDLLKFEVGRRLSFTEVTVVDSQGRLLISRQVGEGFNHQIEIGSLADGIYHLQLISPLGMLSKSFVKHTNF